MACSGLYRHSRLSYLRRHMVPSSSWSVRGFFGSRRSSTCRIWCSYFHSNFNFRILLFELKHPVHWVPCGYFPGGRTAVAGNRLVPSLRIRGSMHPLPLTPSWRSAQFVKHRNNFTSSLLIVFKILDSPLSSVFGIVEGQVVSGRLRTAAACVRPPVRSCEFVEYKAAPG